MKLKRAKLKVSIGIAAYNEEANIGILLQNLTKQKQLSIRVIEILVYSDGSTDNTVKVAKSVRDPRIKIFADTINKGKAYRLNALFHQTKGDVLVLLDADFLPSTDLTLEKICKPFQNKSFKGLSGGRRFATSTKSLTGNGLGNLFVSYDIVRSKLRNGKNLFSFLAGIVAMHRDFAHSLILPLDSPCDDNHIYLEAKKRHLPLSYVPDAIVWFTPPQTIADQISQGSRYLASEAILSRYFDPQFVKKEFSIPISLRLQTMMYQIRKNPIAYIWIKLLSLKCFVNSKSVGQKQGGKWHTVVSTKMAAHALSFWGTFGQTRMHERILPKIVHRLYPLERHINTLTMHLFADVHKHINFYSIFHHKIG